MQVQQNLSLQFSYKISSQTGGPLFECPVKGPTSTSVSYSLWPMTWHESRKRESEGGGGGWKKVTAARWRGCCVSLFVSCQQFLFFHLTGLQQLPRASWFSSQMNCDNLACLGQEKRGIRINPNRATGLHNHTEKDSSAFFCHAFCHLSWLLCANLLHWSLMSVWATLPLPVFMSCTKCVCAMALLRKRPMLQYVYSDIQMLRVVGYISKRTKVHLWGLFDATVDGLPWHPIEEFLPHLF